jgi:pre-peptidase
VKIVLRVIGVILCCALGAVAQEKKDKKKKEPPKVIMAVPLAVENGTTTTVKLRGLRLENATGVRVVDAKLPVEVKIKSKGKAEVPKPLEAPKAGDTQVEIELKLPAEIPDGDLSLVVATPEGESPAYRLRVFEKGEMIAEKEPNRSFRTPQDGVMGKVIAGAIGEAMDVDVFKISAKAGETLVAEVTAARFGSALDSMLMLYDERGQVVASNDDGETGTDSLLRFAIPSDGVFFLTLIDANDRGSVAHPYLLSVRLEK